MPMIVIVGLANPGERDWPHRGWTSLTGKNDVGFAACKVFSGEAYKGFPMCFGFVKINTLCKKEIC